MESRTEATKLSFNNCRMRFHSGRSIIQPHCFIAPDRNPCSPKLILKTINLGIDVRLCMIFPAFIARPVKNERGADQETYDETCHDAAERFAL